MVDFFSGWLELGFHHVFFFFHRLRDDSGGRRSAQLSY